MAGPTHVDDHRVITAGILRQNAQTSLKGASAICHRSDGAVSTFPVGTLISERPPDNPSEPNSGTRLLPWVSNGEPHAGPRMEYLRLREKLICQFRHLRP